MKCLCDKCKHNDGCPAKEEHGGALRCSAYKPQEQTNEEWFCGLSTKEKAKWLSQRSEILYDCGQRDVFPKIMYEEDWEWWLKQPHNGG